MFESYLDIISWSYVIYWLAASFIYIGKLNGFETRRELILFSAAIGFFWPITLPLVAFMEIIDFFKGTIEHEQQRKAEKVRK